MSGSGGAVQASATSVGQAAPVTPAASGVAASGDRGPNGPRRLGLWRLEWLRLVRTRRWLLLVLAYPVVGAVGPAFARHRDRILEILRIDGVPPSNGLGGDSGMAVYAYGAGQMGVLVGLAMMAGALAVDHRPGLAAFHRTRIRRARDLVLPRFTVITAAVSVAYVLGTVVAWAQVHWMFGPLPAETMVYGTLFGVVGLVLELAVVAAVAAFLRRPVAIFGAALVVLNLLPLATLWRPMKRWLPTELIYAQVDLLRGQQPADYGLNLLVATVAAVALMWLAVSRIGRREM